MAIIFPKINSGLLVEDLCFLQEGYEYGINDTGHFQHFRRRGRNRDVENWANILGNAGWNLTVTRERVASNTGSGDTGYNPNTADYGISSIDAQCGWPFPAVYGPETTENSWELDMQDEEKGFFDADFQYGTINLTTYTNPPDAPSSFDVTSKQTREILKKLVTDNTTKWFPAGESYNNSSYGAVLTSSAFYLFDDGLLFKAIQAEAATLVSLGLLMTVSAGIPQSLYNSLPAADYAAAHSQYLLFTSGVESFPIEQPVIRHSMVTSNQYAVKASFNNIDRLISSPSMYSIEGVPTNLLFDVPSKPAPNQFIETPESKPGAGDGDLQYGWRKVRPAVTRLNRQKWRIQQNYQFGLWAIKLYGMPL